MVNVCLSIELVDENISPFELGNICISNDTIQIQSLQSMMIFLSMSELMDVLRRLIEKRPVKELTFVSVDSYFELLFGIKRQTVSIKDKQSLLVIEADLNEFTRIMYQRTLSFYQPYATILEERHNYYDLSDSLQAMKKIMYKAGIPL